MSLISILFIIIALLYTDIYGVSLMNYFNYQKGNDHYLEEQYDDALAEFSKVIESDPESGDIYMNLGNVYFKQGQHDSAFAAYKKSTSLYEDASQGRASAYYNMGTTALRQQKLNDAIILFKEALRHNPYDADAKHNLEISRRLLDEQKKQNQNKQEEEQNKQEKQNEQDEQNKQDEQNNENDHSKKPNPDDQKSEESHQLLDNLSQLEEQARKKYKKLSVDTVLVEKDW